MPNCGPPSGVDPGPGSIEGHPWKGNDTDAPSQFGNAGASYVGGFGAGGINSNSRDSGKKAAAGSGSRCDRWFQNGRR